MKGWRYDLMCRVLCDLRQLTRLRLYGFDWIGFIDMFHAQDGAGNLRVAMTAGFPFPELRELLVDKLALPYQSSHELTLLISLFPRLSRLVLKEIITPPIPGPSYDPLYPADKLGANLRTVVVDFDVHMLQWSIARVVKSLLSPPFNIQLTHIVWNMSSLELRGENNDCIDTLKVALRASQSSLESLQTSFAEDCE